MSPDNRSVGILSYPYRESSYGSVFVIFCASAFTWPLALLGGWVMVGCLLGVVVCGILSVRGFACARLVMDEKSVTIPHGFLQLRMAKVPYVEIQALVQERRAVSNGDPGGTKGTPWVLRLETLRGTWFIRGSWLPRESDFRQVAEELSLRSGCSLQKPGDRSGMVRSG